VGDYLTTKGQESTSDHEMLKDLGFEVEFDFEENEALTV
jgi:biotin synthase